MQLSLTTLTLIGFGVNLLGNLLGPMLPRLLRPRAVKPTPQATKGVAPSNAFRKNIGRWLFWGITSPFLFPPLVIVNNIWNLYRIHRDVQVITVKVVMIIGASFSLIALSLAQIVLLRLVKRVNALRDAILIGQLSSLDSQVKFLRTSFEEIIEKRAAVDRDAARSED